MRTCTYRVEYQGLREDLFGDWLTLASPGAFQTGLGARARTAICACASPCAVHWRFVRDQYAFDIPPSSAAQKCSGLTRDSGNVRRE
jgi:hypothetical protein